MQLNTRSNQDKCGKQCHELVSHKISFMLVLDLTVLFTL